MNKPEYLYKYRSIDMFSEEIICHNTIYLSAPLHFNDPFDSSPDLFATPKEDEAKAIYDNLPIDKQEKIRQQNIKKGDDYSYYSHLFEISNEINNKLSSIDICCFSGAKENILLWSHYANQHKGICIEFKPDYSKYPFSKLNKITYSEEKPKYNNMNESLVDALSIKFIDWDYENEYRIIDQDSTNKSINIDPTEITGVILGFKTSEQDVLTIQNWIKRSKSKNVLI